MKKTLFLSVFFMVCWSIILFVFKWTAMEAVNITFMFGLITLIVFVLMHILRSGFLNLFIEGFRKIGVVLSSKSNAMERADNQLKKDITLQAFKSRMKILMERLVLSFTLASLLVSVVGLIIYY